MANSLAWINASGGDITNGLVGWWKLNDGSGTQAADSSGNSNTGTLVNTPTWSTGFLTFDNTLSQYISTTNVVNIANVTVSAWVNVSSGRGVKEAIVSCQNGFNSNVGDKVLFIDASNRPQFFIYTGNTVITANVSSPQLTSSGWHFICGTWDSTTCKVYLDASSFGSVTDSGGSYAGYTVPNIYIASLSISSDYDYFSGSVDDVRVYNRALSSTEISTLYANGQK